MSIDSHPQHSSQVSSPTPHKTSWQERAARLFCLLVGAVLLGLSLRYALPALLPFLLAWLLSFPVRRGATAMERRLHLPRQIGAVILLLSLLLPLVGLGTTLLRRLLSEAQQLLFSLGNGDTLLRQLDRAVDFFTRITAHIPFLRRLTERASAPALREQIDGAVAGVVSETLARWSARIPVALSASVRAFPSVLLFLITLLLSLFYCCTDDGRISAYLYGLLPMSFRPRFAALRERALRIGARYLRAYFLLFLTTTAQLCFGFSLLRLPYVFLPALLIALLDILPLLGAGCALIPWGIVLLLGGKARQGTGLLVLCGIMLLTRQLLEPRILGKSLGLHPLAALLAVYAGLRLAGIWGMILAPAVAILFKSAWEKPLGESTPPLTTSGQMKNGE